ncbi:MAG: alpha/beta fold hydrolase, partial [Microcoleus sp.]
GRPRTTIVFIHGIAASGKMWSTTIEHIQDARCLTIDLLGFGKSVKPDFLDYSLDEHAKMISYTLRKHRVRGPVIIVGYSLGALVAVEFAKQHPALIRSIILCAPPLYTNEAILQPDVRRQLKDHRSSGYLALYGLIRERQKFAIDAVRRAKLILPIAKTVRLDAETWLPFERTLRRSIEQQTTLLDAERITHPMTIIYGTMDPVIIKGYIRELAQKAYNCRIIKVARATHRIDKRYASVVAEEIEKRILEDTTR